MGRPRFVDRVGSYPPAAVAAAKACIVSATPDPVAGLRADFCVWEAAHPRELAYWFGRNPLRQVVVGGQARA